MSNKLDSLSVDSPKYTLIFNSVSGNVDGEIYLSESILDARYLIFEVHHSSSNYIKREYFIIDENIKFNDIIDARAQSTDRYLIGTGVTIGTAISTFYCVFRSNGANLNMYSNYHRLDKIYKVI